MIGIDRIPVLTKKSRMVQKKESTLKLRTKENVFY